MAVNKGHSRTSASVEHLFSNVSTVNSSRLQQPMAQVLLEQVFSSSYLLLLPLVFEEERKI